MTEQEAIKVMKWYSEEEYGKGLVSESHSMAIQALEEIQQYRAIGTVEELQALKEKSVAKKPYIQQVKFDDYERDGLYCPTCNSFIGFTNECAIKYRTVKHCTWCGQLLDWE